jgi:hypothetical protein
MDSTYGRRALCLPTPSLTDRVERLPLLWGALGIWEDGTRRTWRKPARKRVCRAKGAPTSEGWLPRHTAFFAPVPKEMRIMHF